MARCVLPELQTCDSGRDSVTTALHPVLPPSTSSSSRMSSLWLVMVMVWSVVLLSCPATSSALPSVRSQLTTGPREKPTFLEMPSDVIATESDTVEMRCLATGDPQPSLRWHKLEGDIPAGRTQQLADGTLRVERVQGSDEGLYECVAENVLGEVKALARISVEIGPSFLVTPSNEEVKRGGTATLQCVVTGNPPPTMMWTKEGEQHLMFPGQHRGRHSVSAHGTLRIRDVQDQDAGGYLCQALNVVGVVTASATISVT